jgi:hypothetical protein
MVAAINSIIGGAGVAVAAARFGEVADWVATVIGVVVTGISFVAHLVYEQWSATDLLRRPT